MNFLCSWSGGKDSCYAFYKVLQLGYAPKVLLNVMNEYGNRSRSHGLSKEVLLAQAESIGVPIHFFNATWKEYESKYIAHLKTLVQKFDISHSVFGDIDIDSHRSWEEKVSAAANIKAILPLWKKQRKQLVLDMIKEGFESIIVSCKQDMGISFIGEVLTENTLAKLEAKGVDVCGENGEYHTVVVNAPFFKRKIKVRVNNTHTFNNYNFAELELKS